MKTKHSLSDLIAFRDSQPMDAPSRAAIVGDTYAQAALAELESLQLSLRELPDQELAEDLWPDILARTADKPRRGFPMAVAASVFAFAAAIILYLQPNYMSQTTELPQLSQSEEFTKVNDLQARSQLLQQSLGHYNIRANTNSQGLTRASYLHTIAGVDDRINQLAELDSYNGMQAQQLWEQRVDVLEDWLVMERVDRLQRTAY